MRLFHINWNSIAKAELRWPSSALRDIAHETVTDRVSDPCLWLEADSSQTQVMLISRTSHVPFAELPVEARALLFIIAQAAAPRFVAQPPKRSELTPILAIMWNRKRLCLNDLANPFRMTASLQTDLSSICFAGGVQ